MNVRDRFDIPIGARSSPINASSAPGNAHRISSSSRRVVIDTTDGHLIRKIPVGQGPHGLALMPLPGRYSLGHTGITR